MADTAEEKIQKVRTLYERTSSPGEKAAAFEALKRLLNKSAEEEASLGNWLDEVKSYLIAEGFYMCLAVGNSYLYSKVQEKVQLDISSKTKGNWTYWKAASGKRFAFTDRRPDDHGSTKEQLIKALK